MSFLCRFYVISSIFKKHINYCNTTIYNVSYVECHLKSRIEVTLQDETVWLTLDQMAELFQRNKSTISRHIKNIFDTGELNKELVVAKNATTTQHGAIEGKTQTHQVDFYNLDVIISVGYRVNSYRGVQFRQWAMCTWGQERCVHKEENFPSCMSRGGRHLSSL